MVMIFGIRLDFGVPRRLLGEDSLAINHGRNLVIARAEIEANATAFEMAAGGELHFLRLRHLAGQGHDNLQLFAVSQRHHFAVELPRSTVRINFAQMFADGLGSAHIDLPATDGPEQKLHVALNVAQGLVIAVGADHGFKTGDQAAFAFQSDDQRRGVTGFFRGRDVVAVDEHCGLKARIKRRRGIQFHYFPVVGFKFQNTEPCESVPPEPATWARSV